MARRRKILLFEFPVLLGSSSGLFNLVQDGFHSIRNAGAVNNTNCEYGPGKRLVTDTESKLSISGGVLHVNKKATPAWADPQLYLNPPLIARTAGRVLTFTFKSNSTTSQIMVGWSARITSFNDDASIWQNGNSIDIWIGVNGVETNLNSQPNDTVAQWAIVLRAIGAFWFMKTTGDWSLMWVDDTLANTPLYVRVCNNSATDATVDNIRVPKRLWLPVPAASDKFSGTRSGLGSTDGLGHAEANGGGGLVWVELNGTWEVASSHARCSGWDDGDFGFVVVPTGTADGIFEVCMTRSTGVGGLCLRYVDADNYLCAYHDGTNAALIKRVAGVESNVIAPTAKTYVAGAPLRVVLNGTEARLYYNRAQVTNTTGTVPASSSGLHGLYTNDVGTTFDNFQVWKRT